MADTISREDEKLLSREEVEKILAQFGSREERIQRMREFEDACIRLNDEREALMEKYPNKHVAMNHEGKLFVGDTLDDLFAKFEAHGVSRSGYAREFLDTNPGILLL